MADTKTAPAKPAPKPASSASVKIEPVAPKKDGFDLLRPVRYAMGFIGGTIKHTLDNMSNVGRRGGKIGAVVGGLLVFSGAMAGGLEMIAVGWIAGLAAGAILGGAAGLIGGGLRGMERQERKEKYADDLMRKARAKSIAQSPIDYREAHREYKQSSNYTLDRYFQQGRESDLERDQYFRDMVHQSRSHGPGYGKGW